MKDDNFFSKAPSIATKEKMKLVSSYAKIYFSILKNLDKIKNFKYIDLLAGAGKFSTGEEGTVLRVIELGKDIVNNKFSAYLNDKLHAEALKVNLRNKFDKEFMSKVRITSLDVKDIDLKEIIPKNDAILSFIDPYGYSGVTITNIKLLIENDYSDCIVFLNINNIFRYKFENKYEYQNYINLFGSVGKLKEIEECVKNGEDKNKVINKILKNITSSVKEQLNKDVFFLPFFFRLSDANSTFSHCILVISKSNRGLERVREEVSKGVFRLEDTKLFIDESFNNGTFDFNELDIINIFPDNREEYITRNQILEMLDERERKVNGCLSGVGKSELNKQLRKLIDEKRIYAKNFRSRNGEMTFGDETKLTKFEISNENEVLKPNKKNKKKTNQQLSLFD